MVDIPPTKSVTENQGFFFGVKGRENTIFLMFGMGGLGSRETKKKTILLKLIHNH